MKKQLGPKHITPCKTADSSVCFRQIYNYNMNTHIQKFNTFRTQNVLGNLKFYHFYKNDIRNRKILDKTPLLNKPISNEKAQTNRRSSTTGIANFGLNGEKKVVPALVTYEGFDSDNLLIERQQHACKEFKYDPDYRLKEVTLKKVDFLEQISFLQSQTIENTLAALAKFPYRPRAFCATEVEKSSPNSNQLSPSTVKGTPSTSPSPLPPPSKHVRKESNFEKEDEDELSISDLLKNTDLLKEMRKAGTIEAEGGASRARERSKTDMYLPESDIKERSDSEDEAYDPNNQEAMAESTGNESSKQLFGLAEDDEGEDEMDAKPRFSFIDTNGIDKFNVLEFIHKEENKVAQSTSFVNPPPPS